MPSRKELRNMREIARAEEDLHQDSEEAFNRDMETRPAYASDDIPTDMYKYKRMRLVPDSQAEFKGLLDKDVVLANVQKRPPDPDYLRFMAETIVMVQNVFMIETDVKVPIVKDDKIIAWKVEKRRVFDEEFSVIEDFLRSSFKADLTLSRAMGDQREAILDRTQNFGKEIKRTDKSQNKYV